MKRICMTWLFGVLFALVFEGVSTAGLLPGSESGAVIVNAVPLAEHELRRIDRILGTTPRPGRYWYDKVSGAWGLEGGPMLGVFYPGLVLGGPLRADASRGRTGVFVNGRELHQRDVDALSRFVQVLRGRWWVDAFGNFGPEGGPLWGNLWVLARQRSASGPWTGVSSDGARSLGFDANGCGYFQGSNPAGGATFYASSGC